MILLDARARVSQNNRLAGWQGGERKPPGVLQGRPAFLRARTSLSAAAVGVDSGSQELRAGETEAAGGGNGGPKRRRDRRRRRAAL